MFTYGDADKEVVLEKVTNARRVFGEQKKKKKIGKIKKRMGRPCLGKKSVASGLRSWRNLESYKLGFALSKRQFITESERRCQDISAVRSAFAAFSTFRDLIVNISIK